LGEREQKEYFMNLYYLLIGLLFGIVSNIWVYDLSKWMEVNFPNTDWNLNFLIVSVVYLAFGILLLRYIMHGLREHSPKKSKKKKPKRRKQQMIT
jgi:hypothetical protein